MREGNLFLEKNIKVYSKNLVPSNSTFVHKFTDGGQIFFPAVWPAKSATKAATSVQPRQDVQECVNVSWTPFRNVFKGVPGLKIKWPLLESQSTLTIILKFLSHQELPQNDSAKMACYWRK